MRFLTSLNQFFPFWKRPNVFRVYKRMKYEADTLWHWHTLKLTIILTSVFSALAVNACVLGQSALVEYGLTQVAMVCERLLIATLSNQNVRFSTRGGVTRFVPRLRIRQTFLCFLTDEIIDYFIWSYKDPPGNRLMYLCCVATDSLAQVIYIKCPLPRS